MPGIMAAFHKGRFFKLFRVSGKLVFHMLSQRTRECMLIQPCLPYACGRLGVIYLLRICRGLKHSRLTFLNAVAQIYHASTCSSTCALLASARRLAARAASRPPDSPSWLSAPSMSTSMSNMFSAVDMV